MFQVKVKDVAGRIGELVTRSGKITTPTLLPVINPVRQEVSPHEIKEIGFPAIITNAYLIRKHRFEEALDKGVHGLLGFEGPVMTDSGAYQILEYGSIDVTPREIVEFQEAIGSDIAVILDIPTGMTTSRDEAEWSVEETIRRAEESVKYRSRDDVLWVYPVQGGLYLDLVSRSASKFRELPYHIAAIGSPTPLMEEYRYDLLVDLIVTAKANLPLTAPVHLFGAGHPMIFPLIVALGVDTFDSAAYAIYAKDDRLMTESGTVRLSELEELPCNCPVCLKYTAKELRELPKPLRVKEIARHNLYVAAKELKRVREAIRDGSLWELLEERCRSHPALMQALIHLCENYSWYLEERAPEVKRRVRGLFLYDHISMSRPELLSYRRKLLEYYEKPVEAEVLVLLEGDPRCKPFNRCEEYVKLRETIARRLGPLKQLKVHVAFYVPFLGLVPEELAETYPTSQNEMPRNVHDEVLFKRSARLVAKYVAKSGYKGVVIVDASVFKTLQDLVVSELSSLGVKVVRAGPYDSTRVLEAVETLLGWEAL